MFGFRGNASHSYNISGDKERRSAQAGAVFDLAPGHMGVFAAYDQSEEEYDGEWEGSTHIADMIADLEMEADIDTYDTGIVYGLPLDRISQGFEGGNEKHR